MISGLRKWWDSFRRVNSKPDSKESPFRSVVLLLRTPSSISIGELQAAAERAWERKFDGVEDKMYFAFENKPLSIVKAGESVMQVLQAGTPYLPHTPEVLKELYQPEQKKAFLSHFAWLSIDQWNKDLDKGEAYSSLSRLALQLVDENCTAVYLPDENILMPNDGTAEEGLWRLVRRELLQ